MRRSDILVLCLLLVVALCCSLGEEVKDPAMLQHAVESNLLHKLEFVQNMKKGQEHHNNIQRNHRTISEDLEVNQLADIDRMKAMADEMRQRVREHEQILSSRINDDQIKSTNNIAKSSHTATVHREKRDAMSERLAQNIRTLHGTGDMDHTEGMDHLHQRTSTNRPAFPGRDNDHHSTGKGQVRTVLEAHGVTDSLIQEINRMSAANVPRANIIQHVGMHFPEKRPDDINDIVIAAVAATNRVIKKGATDKAKKQEASFNSMLFERKKNSMQTQLDL